MREGMHVKSVCMQATGLFHQLFSPSTLFLRQGLLFLLLHHVFYAVWPVNLLSVLSLPHFTVECWDSDVCHQIQLFFFFFSFLEAIYLFIQSPPDRPSWNSLCRIRIRLAFGLRSACFCLLTAKIKGVYWLSVL